MTEKLKTFLAGVGSILDISSSTEYSDFVCKKTPEDRIRSHWENVGKHISKAINDYGQEQKK